MDLIIKNAHILTLNETNDIARSVAVQDGRIVDLWKAKTPPAEVLLRAEKVIDLQGETLIPGFIDTHNHILSHGLMLDMVNCSSPLNHNIDDILQSVKAKIDSLPIGEWVQGFGYDDTLLAEKRHPTRKELDAVSPNHPVYLNHSSGHIAVVNTKALTLAGITETIEDTSKGQFGRDEDGLLNGVLFEHGAMAKVNQIIPEKTEDEMIELLRRATEQYVAEGITVNTVAAVGMMFNTKLELGVHFRAGKKRVNPMRTRIMLVHPLLEEGGIYEGYSAKEIDQAFRQQSDDRVRLDSAKLFQDGSIQGYTGALRKPYEKKPDKIGELIHEQNVLNEKLLALHNRGFRIAIHGNGGRAIESILTAYESILRTNPRPNHRHRIEHAQTATTSDIERMKELDVASSFFINHVYYFGDRHRDIFLGYDRASRMNPVQTAVNYDILFTLHSDCPITPISPLFSIWAAVNRLTISGERLGEEEQCDVLEALKSMTIYGAKLNFEEEEAGSIEVGKRADFAVLSHNPLTVPPMAIKDIQVLQTYIDGEIVYEK